MSKRTFCKRIVDLCFLLGAALAVCAIGVGAFVIADVRHINPLWVFFSLFSIGFFVFAWEEYRNALRSIRFVLFICGWVLVNIVIMVVVLGYFGWLWVIGALLLAQALFYMSAEWLFGLKPLSRRANQQRNTVKQ
jgi:hypothetical protein